MLELLSLLLGGGLRLIPEFLKVWTAKKDQDHELRMTRLQLEIDATRAKLDIDKTHATANASEQVAWAQALVESMMIVEFMNRYSWAAWTMLSVALMVNGAF